VKRRHLLRWLLSLPWLAGSPFAASVASAAGDDTDAHQRAANNSLQQRPRIAVIGAGALGGWAALQLQQRGARVTLFDAWDPGHPRSSSGGETRLIRHAYSSLHHVELAARALTLWQQAVSDWQQPLLQQTGVLFMAQAQGMQFLQQAITHLQQAGVAHEVLTATQLRQRYPQIDSAGMQQALLEPESGYLLARRACAAVVLALQRAGGVYKQASVQPGVIRDGEMQSLRLNAQDSASFDQYVFACGPWLAQLFPQLLAPLLQITRQEVMFFGTPAGDRPHDQAGLPVWADFGERIWYGIPGSERRGFKLADDTRGAAFDAERGDRRLSDSGLSSARDYLAQRFPALRNAPLIDARVCQYSNTPDGDFIVDRHPQADNVLLLGGGNGHAFKHAPALGELAAQVILTDKALPEHYLLSRFNADIADKA